MILQHINVTDVPYLADPTGYEDCTQAFQLALDAAAGKTTCICPQMVIRPLEGVDRGIGIHHPRQSEANTSSEMHLITSQFRYPVHDPCNPEEIHTVIGDDLQPNIVYVPTGIYRIDGPIFIPPNVTLQGSWILPPREPDNFPSPFRDQNPWWDPAEYLPRFKGAGTVFITDYGRNYEYRYDKYAFINLLGPNSILSGVTIYYPNQGVQFYPNSSGDSPFQYKVIPYQWTIRAAPTNPIKDPKAYPELLFPGCSPVGNGRSCKVSNVLLLNSYCGIDFSYYSGKHILQHIWGQPIREGIRIDHCYDVGRILDIHFWPFWGDFPKSDDKLTFLRDFISAKAFALVLLKSDWEIVHDFFAFGYYVGVHLGRREKDCVDDSSLCKDGERKKERSYSACSAQFTNLNLDQCTNGIDYHAAGKNGVQVSNANIVCKKPYLEGNQPFLPDLPRHAIVGHAYPDATGFLSIRGASVFGKSKGPMVSWHSEQSTLMISSSWIKNEADTNLDKIDSPVINVGAGKAIIQGNWFQAGAGGDAVFVGKDVKLATVTGNMSEGHKFKAEYKLTGDIMYYINRLKNIIIKDNAES